MKFVQKSYYNGKFTGQVEMAKDDIALSEFFPDEANALLSDTNCVGTRTKRPYKGGGYYEITIEKVEEL